MRKLRVKLRVPALLRKWHLKDIDEKNQGYF